MAKERFSKLQRWILHTMVENYRKEGAHLKRPYIYREEIYTGFFKCNPPKFGTWPQKYIVTVSRSLKRLEERGLIRPNPPWDRKKVLYVYTEEFVDFINKSVKKPES